MLHGQRWSRHFTPLSIDWHLYYSFQIFLVQASKNARSVSLSFESFGLRLKPVLLLKSLIITDWVTRNDQLRLVLLDIDGNISSAWAPRLDKICAILCSCYLLWSPREVDTCCACCFPAGLLPFGAYVERCSDFNLRQYFVIPMNPSQQTQIYWTLLARACCCTRRLLFVSSA